MSEAVDQEWQQSLYEQLYHLSQAALSRESPGHTLQPTLIVHDVYLRLQQQKNLDQNDRSQLLAAAATIMRRILVDYARARKALKRGAGEKRQDILHISVADRANELDVLELHEALTMLADQNRRAAQVVELRFFGGLTGEETAKYLEVSLGTVNSDWRFAKAWLYRHLKPAD